MPVVRNKSYEVSENGLQLEGGVHLSSAPTIPSHNGLVGDRYFNSADGTEWVLEANGSLWIPKRIIKRLLVSQASTVVAPAAITGFTTQSLPVGYYKFYTLIKIRSASTANGYGLRFQNVAATVSDIMAQWRLPVNADFSTTHNIIYSQRLLTQDSFAGTVATANTDYAAVGEGFFNVSVAGSVTIQFRSETAGTAVTVGSGSFLEVERI